MIFEVSDTIGSIEEYGTLMFEISDTVALYWEHGTRIVLVSVTFCSDTTEHPAPQGRQLKR